MGERFVLALILFACTPEPTHVHRDLTLQRLPPLMTSSFPGEEQPVSFDGTTLALPQGMAVIFLRSPGPPIDYSLPAVSLDPTIAQVRATTDFDSLAILALAPGTATIHFPDGETSDVIVAVAAP